MIDHNLAIVFPGQGSQSVGMLNDIAEQHPIVKQTFAEASMVLGYDLWQLVAVGPAEKLNQTQYTQPALLAASYAIWRILASQSQFKKPALLAGHSLGEYTALVCANAISFTDAIKLVAARGEYMQAAVPENIGAMAAIVGLTPEEVQEICDAARLPQEVLAPANFNSIGQIVIAGHRASVLKAVEIAKEKQAKLATLIPVSVPSHCELMRGAAESLAILLQTITIQKPEIAVINNVRAQPYTDEASIREGLAQQLYKPVRWVEIIQYFIQYEIKTILECGPAKVLTGLNKRIDKQLQLFATTDLNSLETFLTLERG